MEEKLKNANKRLLIKDDSNEERDRNIIFVYCPPKVGSTSLVTSLRLFCYEKFTILHLHGEEILKTLYDIDVTINDIIEYNSSLGKKVYVIDIYRFPIEQKISIFFEKLEKYHFNNSVEHIEKFPIDKLITRFNNIFPYLGKKDFFRKEYCITYPDAFDFEKKYCLVEKGNIQYIKLRLSDSSTHWENILREILHIDIKIIRDYESSEKPIKHIFKKFVENYKIPKNLFNLIKEDNSLSFYNNTNEVKNYINIWEQKKTVDFVPYTTSEYMLYTRISSENQYISEIEKDHYIDNGCPCKKCMEKRIILREKIKKGEKVEVCIKHEKQKITNVVTTVLFKKKIGGPISLNMMKGNR